MLEHLLTRGIINWGRPVADILADGNLYIQEARSAEGSGLVSILLEGPPNAGKTALAAQIAKNSDFPFVKICTPEDMVGYTESAKCLMIRKVMISNRAQVVDESLMCGHFATVYHIHLFRSSTTHIDLNSAVSWWTISSVCSTMVLLVHAIRI